MLPVIFQLNCGDRFAHSFGSSRVYVIELSRVDVRTEPLFQSGQWFSVFRDARVQVLIDGLPHTLVCAPYQMPVVIDGLRLEVDLVAEVAGGLRGVDLTKEIRIAALAAEHRWLGEADLALPMPDYRWRASNYMHTWNGFVHVVEYIQPPAIYYHRGEDFGAYPDRHPLNSAVSGTYTQIPPPGGDGGSNLMTVCGEEVCIRYAHANNGFIDRRLQVGNPIALGQQLALTGGTWQGRSGISDPHLHMAAFVLMDGQEVPVNCYSRYVEAYQARYPQEILPVAGGYRFSRVGQRIELDASRSILPADCTSPRYTWTLSDGTKQEGAQISFQIDQAGNYTQMLSISDHQGCIAHDSVMVYVSDGQCQKLPFATINHYPVRGLRAGEEVALLIHVSDMENAQVDFGDGLRVNWQQELRHVYREPGDYFVTVTGQSPSAQGYFRAVVRVEG